MNWQIRICSWPPLQCKEVNNLTTEYPSSFPDWNHFELRKKIEPFGLLKRLRAMGRIRMTGGAAAIGLGAFMAEKEAIADEDDGPGRSGNS